MVQIEDLSQPGLSQYYGLGATLVVYGTCFKLLRSKGFASSQKPQAWLGRRGHQRLVSQRQAWLLNLPSAGPAENAREVANGS